MARKPYPSDVMDEEEVALRVVFFGGDLEYSSLTNVR